jgi:hypothetical protein
MSKLTAYILAADLRSAIDASASPEIAALHAALDAAIPQLGLAADAELATSTETPVKES